MLTHDLRLDDDPPAIAADVRALAVEAHAVLTRDAASGTDRRPEVPIDLRRRIEGFRRVLEEGRPCSGRLRDVRLWLDGLRRHALVLRDLGEIH
jgi:hypothetical protein